MVDAASSDGEPSSRPATRSDSRLHASIFADGEDSLEPRRQNSHEEDFRDYGGLRNEEVNDLIVKTRDVAAALPEGNPERPYVLSGLSEELFTRYDKFEDLKDLEEAISTAQDVLSSSPKDYLKMTTLLKLGAMHHSLLAQSSDMENMVKAISVTLDAISIDAASSRLLPMALADFGIALYRAYERPDRILVLEMAIFETAAAATRELATMERREHNLMQMAGDLRTMLTRLRNREEISNEWMVILFVAFARVSLAAFRRLVKAIEVELRAKVMLDALSGEELEALHFRPLEKSEIRLIRLIRRPTPDSPISCEFRYHKLGEKPVYVALSYVWGAKDGTIPITVDGQALKVTQNLFDALIQLEQSSSLLQESLGMPSTELLIWIDAICINQKDDGEKAEQIPKMGDIYSKAHVTLVWLGPIHYKDQDAVAILHRMARWINQDSSMSHDSKGQHSIRLQKAEYLALTDIYERVAINAWFDRVWVVQEYALSQREPQVLLGDRLFTMKSLSRISSAMGDASHSIIGGRFRFMENIRTILSDEVSKMPPPRQILSLLRETAYKKCGRPHDHIYGILGMIKTPPHAENGPTPDYTLPVGDVFEEWSKYVIKGTGSLAILSCTKNELEGTPSWVPDLQQYFRFPGKTVFTDAKWIKFSEDGKQLTVHGREIGRIAGYSVKNGSDNTSEWLRSFEEKLLVPWAENCGQPLSTAFTEWLSGIVRFLTLSVDYFSQYGSMEELIEGYRKHLAAVELEHDRNDELGLLMKTLETSTHCFLEDGEIMLYLGYKNIPRPNDQVWVWMGFGSPAIVRVTDKGCEYAGSLVSLGKWKNIDESTFSNGDLMPITLV